MGFFQSSVFAWITWFLWLFFYVATIWVCRIGNRNIPNRGWIIIIIANIAGIVDHLVSFIPGFFAMTRTDLFPQASMSYEVYGILQSVHWILASGAGIVSLYGLYKLAKHKLSQLNLPEGQEGF